MGLNIISHIYLTTDIETFQKNFCLLENTYSLDNQKFFPLYKKSLMFSEKIYIKTLCNELTNEKILSKFTEKYSLKNLNYKTYFDLSLSNQDKFDINNIVFSSIGLKKKALLGEEVEAVPPLSEQPFCTRNMRVETYEDVTVNLSAEQRDALETALEQLLDQKSRLDQLKRCIASNTLLESSLFTLPNFQLYALLALKRGVIDGTAFTTCILFNNQYKATNPTEIKRVALFDGNIPNRAAWKMIAQCALKRSGQDGFDPHDVTVDSQQTFLNEQQFIRFRELMRSQPAFEQQFLLVPEKSKELHTLTHRLGEVGYNMFMSVNTADGPMMMVASKSMCQLYLFAQNERTAPDLNACFLLSSEERIVDQLLTNQHDMYIDFDFFEKVQSVDGLASCPEVQGATKHDVYHAQVLLYIPLEIRKRFYHLAKLFSEIAKDLHEIPQVEAVAKRAAFVIGEGEHRTYEEAYDVAAKVTKFSPSQAKDELPELHHVLAYMPRVFWKSITVQLNHAQKFVKHREFFHFCVKDFVRRLIAKQEHYMQLGIPVGALKELVNEKDKRDSVFVSCVQEVLNEQDSFSNR